MRGIEDKEEPEVRKKMKGYGEHKNRTKLNLHKVRDVRGWNDEEEEKNFKDISTTERQPRL